MGQSRKWVEADLFLFLFSVPFPLIGSCICFTVRKKKEHSFTLIMYRYHAISDSFYRYGSRYYIRGLILSPFQTFEINT